MVHVAIFQIPPRVSMLFNPATRMGGRGLTSAGWCLCSTGSLDIRPTKSDPGHVLIPADTRLRPNVGLMLGQRLRRRPSINPALHHSHVCSGVMMGSWVVPGLAGRWPDEHADYPGRLVLPSFTWDVTGCRDSQINYGEQALFTERGCSRAVSKSPDWGYRPRGEWAPPPRGRPPMGKREKAHSRDKRYEQQSDSSRRSSFPPYRCLSVNVKINLSRSLIHLHPLFSLHILIEMLIILKLTHWCGSKSNVEWM